MKELPNVEVQMVDYTWKLPFLQQLQLTHNSDIFMSIHGSGLTHLLFLPDWAAVFEIYNCDDSNCYWDLARLRGVKYFTWQKQELLWSDSVGRHPTRPEEEHKKFTNYGFDKTEFIRIVKQMIDYVRRNPKFVAKQRKLRRLQKDKENLKTEL
ncbi:unnamed protein product, partial [Mesorhabditis belari]|uniref:EGF domain-specific O-linked N-acetylglucosamine transferase n=1 Tax=Mesorhabditis belari TaxID=2138241 RepID=A0AAF3EZ65_9BILA